MSKYLYEKFYGKYRILAHLDLRTNDWPRDKNGNIETDDFYIPCKGDAMIYHYGQNILAAFIPSTIKGHKLLKMCKEEGIDTFDIMEGDGEISFKFKSKDIDFIASYLKAKTVGKDTRPFSTKNLPTSDYTLPAENLQEYKEITGQLAKGDTLIISQITNRFMDEILAKKYRRIDINFDMRKKCMHDKLKNTFIPWICGMSI